MSSTLPLYNQHWHCAAFRLQSTFGVVTQRPTPDTKENKLRSQRPNHKHSFLSLARSLSPLRQMRHVKIADVVRGEKKKKKKKVPAAKSSKCPSVCLASEKDGEREGEEIKGDTKECCCCCCHCLHRQSAANISKGCFAVEGRLIGGS